MNGFPVYRNNFSEYYPLGEMQFCALAEEIRRAEVSIYMEFFIIREGTMLSEIASILEKKAADGVDVRILYDGFGTGLTGLPITLKRLCRQIRCREFSPVRRLHRLNNRDHRKLVIIDGKTAFIGSGNIADEYINSRERFGHWRDTGVMIKGEAVRSFTSMFLKMWGEPELSAVFDRFDTGAGFVQPFGDVPHGIAAGKSVYISLVNSAESEVFITTPYLVPDKSIIESFTAAAARGTEVNIILPGIPDKRYVHILTKSHYRRLLSAGVKIYEYVPGFIHAKMCVSDGRAAVVGSFNLDRRSFCMNYEAAVLFYGGTLPVRIASDMKELLLLCRSGEGTRLLPGERFAAGVLNILSPFF